MDAKTAIERIEDVLSYAINYDESIEYQLTSYDIDWLETAKEALEYRIPKEPVSIKADKDIKIGAGTWKKGVTVYKCPCCNSFISRSSDFCNKCGQKISWRQLDES